MTFGMATPFFSKFRRFSAFWLRSKCTLGGCYAVVRGSTRLCTSSRVWPKRSISWAVVLRHNHHPWSAVRGGILPWKWSQHIPGRGAWRSGREESGGPSSDVKSTYALMWCSTLVTGLCCGLCLRKYVAFEEIWRKRMKEWMNVDLK